MLRHSSGRSRQGRQWFAPGRYFGHRRLKQGRIGPHRDAGFLNSRHHVGEICGGHSIDWHGLPDVINCRVTTPPVQLHYAINRCPQDHCSTFLDRRAPQRRGPTPSQGAPTQKWRLCEIAHSAILVAILGWVSRDTVEPEAADATASTARPSVRARTCERHKQLRSVLKAAASLPRLRRPAFPYCGEMWNGK